MILAQALAEYVGLVSRTGGASLDNLLLRVSNASPLEYLFVFVGVLSVLYLITRLLDAA
jgi:hypothetical protein